MKQTRSGSRLICHPLSGMRRWLLLLGSVALIAIVVIGLTSASGGDSSTDPPDSLADARKELAGALGA